MTRSVAMLNAEVAERLARFKTVFIPYPAHVALHAEFHYLRELARQMPGKPQMGVRVLAPSGSGKTSSAQAYIDLVSKQTPNTDDYIPIIKIDLERHTTSKKLMVLILQAFGDPHPEHGNELTLKKRVIACFKRFKTELLIVDEVQHLNYRNGVKNDVTDTLKGLLDAGVVSIAFLGTDEAEKMFGRNLQLNGRLRPPCDLKPLDALKVKDQQAFAGFVSRIDQSLVDVGGFTSFSELTDPSTLAALFDVSKGIVGRVMRLIHVAMEAAIRRGANRITLEDLSWAVDAWAIEQAFTNKNPFKEHRVG
ncbi:MAG: TniB family NTP-binding protein [Janthinobacterium lividum]